MHYITAHTQFYFFIRFQYHLALQLYSYFLFLDHLLFICRELVVLVEQLAVVDLRLTLVGINCQAVLVMFTFYVGEIDDLLAKPLSLSFFVSKLYLSES